MIQITHDGIILDSDYTIRVDCDLIEPKIEHIITVNFYGIGITETAETLNECLVKISKTLNSIPWGI